ncbi:sigma-54-dependent Fis family transcriptional regulator [Candidatus Dependentiae bacterium]|nr:sigma-54-dependent Fis family transcriptional regulator [Candidatus Dependentiae bacterium]
MKTIYLSNEEREIFSMISEAVFANPFSDERLEIDRKISKSDYCLTRDQIFERLTRTVEHYTIKLNNENRANIKYYTDRDKSVITSFLLFEIFHKYIDRFDKLILKQMESGDKSCHVNFTNEIIKVFNDYGFSEDESLHYTALFYQLRRAYYFITSLLIGKSKCMKQLRMHLWQNIFSYNLSWYDIHLNARMEDFSTLLIGETGTGKGSAAFAAGCSGFIPFDKTKQCFIESFTRAFISINLSQFSETLIESELFGHKKGAFTGAIDSHQGVLARSSKCGAVFLDEIGDASIPIQIKLLKVLQERIFSPVGSHEQLRFNGRVIAATNHTLRELRKNKGFREDFYYRLCSDIIELPPLRERIKEEPEELNELIEHILKRMTGKKEAPKELLEFVEKSIFEKLGNDYHWSGNVRELEQCVRRILLKGKYDGDIPKPAEKSGFLQSVETGSLNVEQLISGYIEISLKKYKTVSECAEKLGIDRRTVKKYSNLIPKMQ